MPYAHRDTSNSSFPIWMSFIYFFFLPEFSGWWKWASLFWFPILKEKFSIFHPDCDVSCGLVIYTFIMLRNILVIPNCWEFYYEKMLNFVLHLHWLRWSGSLSFILLIWCFPFTDLCMLNHPCNPEINTTWSWCMSLLTFCWISLLVLCWEILHLYLSGILTCSCLFY